MGDAIVVLLAWMVTILLVGGVLLLGLQRVFPDVDSQALSLPLTTLLLIVVCVGYVRWRYPGAERRLFGPAPLSWRAFGLGIGAGIAALLVIIIGMGTVLELLARAMRSQLPEVQETFREIARDRSAAPFLVVGSVFFAPVAEELFYRGLFFTALRRRMDLWPAMGLSAVLFGLSHLQTTLDGYLLVLLIIIPLGMFLAYIYERTRTLLVPIAAHAVFNLVQVVQLIEQVR